MGAAYALPTGGQVAFGTGAVSQTGGAMTIRQDSQNLGLNWQSFGIGGSESVTFVQPNASSIALNRVLGSDPSAIYGRLSANGQVWLLNPNGVLFGSGAQVSVGGLVASTLNLSDADFLAGKRTFSGSGGTVFNGGTLTAADGGYIALLGGRVSNEGTIQARLGTVALAAGKQVTLDFAGDRLVNLQVDQGAVDALAENKQLIRADGGLVVMTAQGADAVLNAVVNNQGVIEAQTVDTSTGVIRLLGGNKGGTVKVAGTLDASAPNGGQGGLVETSGDSVKVADDAHITTASASGAGATGTWLIDPTDFTIAAKGGDISGTALANQLASNNVKIVSSQGSSAGPGDIRVNDAVTWNSANSLSLSALHDVRVARAITANGSGSLTLRADNTGACVAGAVNCGTVRFVAKGHVTLNGGALNIYYNSKGSNVAADANGNGPSYATPTDFSSDVTLRKGSTLTAWMLINDVNQLQAINTNLSGTYALGRDIDASATNRWNGGAGFAPLGFDDSTNIFSGQFDGSGHVISSLTINRPTETFVGLFGVSRGRIDNVGLSDVDVRGNESVGGLVGQNDLGAIGNSDVTGNIAGSSNVGGLVGISKRDIGPQPRVIALISNSYFKGSVSGESNVGGLVGGGVSNIDHSYAAGRITGGDNVGGLVGSVAGSNTDSPSDGGLISNSHFRGSVSGASNVGGLVGSGMYHLISDSYATGQVSGGDYVGGLIGDVAYLTISNSHFTGSVRGKNFVGGLVGSSGFTTVSNSYSAGRVAGVSHVGGMIGSSVFSLIEDSHSNSAVVGESNVGGLVGTNIGVIFHSYATGNVTGKSEVGGLVGDNQSDFVQTTGIAKSYATGNVSGAVDVGGLVGRNSTRIDNSYATGKVRGDGDVGGLVGGNRPGGTISTSYSTGAVSGQVAVGGLVGLNEGTITNSYWDIQTSGTSVGVGSGDTSGVTGLTDQQMKQKASFAGFDFSNVWNIVEGRSYPFLRR